MSPITVLLAEDHMIVREGLRALLKVEKDIRVIGEADNGRESVGLARTLCPDVVIMDIAMPLLNGLEATRQILRHHPATKVLILSAHSDDAYVEHAMAHGASGYLIKQTAAHVLASAIREVHQGKLSFSPIIAKRFRQPCHSISQAGNSTVKPSMVRLTHRETEVLQLIAEGKANKETAAELKISIKTVEKHRQKVMSKLNIHDTAGLTRYAIACGIIENSIQSTVVQRRTDEK